MQIFLTDEDEIKKEDVNQEKYIIEIQNKETYHHLVDVLRIKKEDNISVITKEKKRINGKIYSVKKESINIIGKEVKEKTEEDDLIKFKYILLQGIPKARKLELICEKTTEIGIDKIIPLEMTRSIVRKKDLKENKIERLNSILKSAAEQSKRKDIPVLEKPKTIDEIIDLLDKESEKDIIIEKHILIFYENEDKNSLKNVLKNINNKKENLIKNKNQNQSKKIEMQIYILIGPEGGITEDELEKINRLKNVEVVSLGENILRTETAPISALSIIKYELENDLK